MQKLGSNDVRLRSDMDIFEALDELYPMGGVPGVFDENFDENFKMQKLGSNDVRLR